MRILQIGCGGIGSYLIQEIAECIEQQQIDAFADIRIADEDIVEVNQYQNFTIGEVGQNKAKALAKRFKDCCSPIPKRITKESQLRNYDIIILCVDNEKAREENDNKRLSRKQQGVYRFESNRQENICYAKRTSP